MKPVLARAALTIHATDFGPVRGLACLCWWVGSKGALGLAQGRGIAIATATATATVNV